MVEDKDMRDGATTARSPLSPLRSQKLAGIPARTSSNSPGPNQIPRRRSSMISLGTESVSSLRSTTDDLLLPRVSISGLQEESSALHSAPLFLAIVPAVAGLLFQNGSSIMTDVTLLACAAILLNWSIRLPWDWYRSAQAVRVHDSVSTEDYLPMADSRDTILEEDDEDPAPDGELDKGSSDLPRKATVSAQQLSAASQLRIHEMLALISCFLGPLAGAWLLHAIRSQLSRPSEGLVSNYNLTIFLLASEIRPLSHLVKLIQNRTLHLQRIVAQSTHSGSGQSPSISIDEITALAARVAALEGGSVADGQSNGSHDRNLQGPAAREMLAIDVRRSLQPDIDALNRAVRRYEKRATLLSMQIDGRLNTLETRMQDTLSLAAAAERSASSPQKGSAGVLLDWMAGIVVLPVQLITKTLELPGKLLRYLLRLFKEITVIVLPQSWLQQLQQTDQKPKVKREKTRIVKKSS